MLPSYPCQLRFLPPAPEDWSAIGSLIHSFIQGGVIQCLWALSRCEGKTGLGFVLPLITRKHLLELFNWCELRTLLSGVEMTTLDLCHRVVMTASNDQGNRRVLRTAF